MSKQYHNKFNRELLPNPAQYYREQGLKLSGGGDWKNALCPFHEDTKPSLRLRIDSGGFKCMACGAHGGGIIDFHMQRYRLNFKETMRDLGALKVVR